MNPRHYLRFKDFSRDEYAYLFERTLLLMFQLQLRQARASTHCRTTYTHYLLSIHALHSLELKLSLSSTVKTKE